MLKRALEQADVALLPMLENMLENQRQQSDDISSTISRVDDISSDSSAYTNIKDAISSANLCPCTRGDVPILGTTYTTNQYKL